MPSQQLIPFCVDQLTLMRLTAHQGLFLCQRGYDCSVNAAITAPISAFQTMHDHVPIGLLWLPLPFKAKAATVAPVDLPQLAVAPKKYIGIAHALFLKICGDNHLRPIKRGFVDPEIKHHLIGLPVSPIVKVSGHIVTTLWCGYAKTSKSPDAIGGGPPPFPRPPSLSNSPAPSKP